MTDEADDLPITDDPAPQPPEAPPEDAAGSPTPGVFVERTVNDKGEPGVRLHPQTIDEFAIPSLLELAYKAAHQQIVG